MRSLIHTVLITGTVLLAAGPLVAQERPLSGKITLQDEPTQPLPGLTVTLIPPKDVKRPSLLTGTGPDGKYKFKNVLPGKYLLEVHQATKLVHREELKIDAAVQRLTTNTNVDMSSVDITLKKKR